MERLKILWKMEHLLFGTFENMMENGAFALFFEQMLHFP